MARWHGTMSTAIERHGGTVEKFIGDAVMAVFGVPFVHEDDALRAGWTAAGIPLVLIPALGFAQGGYQPGAWVWAGAVAAWACAVAVVVTADPGALRRAWPWALAWAGVLLWTILSASWSAHASQS